MLHIATLKDQATLKSCKNSHLYNLLQKERCCCNMQRQDVFWGHALDWTDLQRRNRGKPNFSVGTMGNNSLATS